MTKTPSIQQRGKQLFEFIENLCKQKLTYVELWNATFGVGARYSQLFPTLGEREQFERTTYSKKVNEVLNSAPRPQIASSNTGRVLLRLPKSLHAALIDEAKLEGTSMNQLILAKLAVSLHQTVAPSMAPKN